MKKIMVLLAVMLLLASGALAVSFWSSSSNLLTGNAVVQTTSGPYEWTSWLNRDYPGGVGDFETTADFVRDGDIPCANPVAIECVTYATGADYTTTGEVYSCDPKTGGVCRNDNQPDDSCQNYKVRFGCPVENATEQFCAEDNGIIVEAYAPKNGFALSDYTSSLSFTLNTPYIVHSNGQSYTFEVIGGNDLYQSIILSVSGHKESMVAGESEDFGDLEIFLEEVSASKTTGSVTGKLIIFDTSLHPGVELNLFLAKSCDSSTKLRTYACSGNHAQVIASNTCSYVCANGACESGVENERYCVEQDGLAVTSNFKKGFALEEYYMTMVLDQNRPQTVEVDDAPHTFEVLGGSPTDGLAIIRVTAGTAVKTMTMHAGDATTILGADILVQSVFMSDADTSSVQATLFVSDSLPPAAIVVAAPFTSCAGGNVVTAACDTTNTFITKTTAACRYGCLNGACVEASNAYNTSVDLKVNGVDDPAAVLQGGTFTVTWTSSPDIVSCDTYGNFVPTADASALWTDLSVAPNGSVDLMAAMAMSEDLNQLQNVSMVEIGIQCWDDQRNDVTDTIDVPVAHSPIDDCTSLISMTSCLDDSSCYWDQETDACLSFATPKTCSDPDHGDVTEQTHTYGFRAGVTDEREARIRTGGLDVCVDNETLKEYYCSDSMTIASKTWDCTCVAGACIDDQPSPELVDIAAIGFNLRVSGDEAQMFMRYSETGLVPSDNYVTTVYIGFEPLVYLQDSDESTHRAFLQTNPVFDLTFSDDIPSWVNSFYLVAAMDNDDDIDESFPNNNCVRQEFQMVRDASGKVVNVKKVGLPVVGCNLGYDLVDMTDEELLARYAPNASCSVDSDCDAGMACFDGLCKQAQVSSCDTCLYGDACVPIGYRTPDDYCSLQNGFVSQKESGSYCNNNFECSSNLCLDSQCVEQGFLDRLLEFLRRLF